MRLGMMCGTLVTVWGALGAQVALAQEVDWQQHTESIALAGLDPRSVAGDQVVLTEGTSTLFAQMRFLTAAEGLGVGKLSFTDVVLMDIQGRRSLGGKADLYGGLTLLPKQPSQTGELIWQRANLGGRVGFAKRFAFAVNAQGGPLLAHRGQWAAADIGIEARRSLHETFYVQGAVRGAGTALFYKDAASGRQGFGEVVIDGLAVFHDPMGISAGWIGTDFCFPVLTFAGKETAPALDAQTRVNFRIGASLSYIRQWDISAEFIVSDRGDSAQPSTQLPILDGGFDQTLFMLGFTRRFGGQ